MSSFFGAQFPSTVNLQEWLRRKRGGVPDEASASPTAPSAIAPMPELAPAHESVTVSAQAPPAAAQSFEEWLTPRRQIGAELMPQPQTLQNWLIPAESGFAKNHPRITGALEGALMGAAFAKPGDLFSGVRGLAEYRQKRADMAQANPLEQLKAGMAVMKPFEESQLAQLENEREAALAADRGALYQAQAEKARREEAEKPLNVPAGGMALIPDPTSPDGYRRIQNPTTATGALTEYQRQSLAMREREFAARQAALQRASLSGEMNPKQISVALQLANSLKAHPAYTDMLDISTGMGGVRSGLSQKNGFGDITAINSFQRMADPGATVRAEDVKLIQSASSLIQRILSEYPIERLRSGAQLPEAVRQAMQKTAKDLYQVRATNYNTSVGEQYKKLAAAATVPFEMIGSDFSTAEDSPTPSSASTPTSSGRGFRITLPSGMTIEED